MERDANGKIVFDDELNQQLFSDLNEIGFSGHVANFLVELIYRIDKKSR